MKMFDYIGQSFRDKIGGPYKYETYNIGLKFYKEIVAIITELENETINYMYKHSNSDLILNDYYKKRLVERLSGDSLSDDEYHIETQKIKDDREEIISNFIDSSDLLFIRDSKQRLYLIKQKNVKDNIIQKMSFDTWDEMNISRDLADIVIAKIETNTKYIDAKEVYEIIEKYKRDMHMRRER